MLSSDASRRIHPPDPHPEILLDHALTPMEAVNILYSPGEEALSEAIVASLGRSIFDREAPPLPGRARRAIARGMLGLMRGTTTHEFRKGADQEEMKVYRNRFLERSRHPYAMTLLEPSLARNAAFVEGGDPMNAPYMMLCPTIARNANTWDRMLLNSVQGRDVQLRFLWEARSIYEAARIRLETGKQIRVKVAAAGTGLCPIVVFDRLIRDGYDPDAIAMVLTDRDEVNVAKTGRLLEKLATTGRHLADPAEHSGITARVMDLLHDIPSQRIRGGHDPYDVVTLIGILEYFRGHTCATTEELHGEPIPADEADGVTLIREIAEMTAESGLLIANTYRVEPGARILEVFGKRLRYRNREDLHALAATGGFHPLRTVGSGNVYDVEVFEKKSDAAA